MNDILAPDEKHLLEDLCQKYGAKPKLVEDLIRIEKRSQHMERRHGIYDELRRCIRDSTDARDSEA